MQLAGMICAVLSFEILVIAFIGAFNGIPSVWVKTHLKGVTLTLFTLSFLLGVAAGVLFTMDAGEAAVIHYVLAFFPGLFLILKVVGHFAGWNMEEQKTIVMRAEEYTLASTMENLSVGDAMYKIHQVACWNGQPVYFSGAAPAEPVDILAFGAMDKEVFVCTGYEPIQKKKKTRKEIIESIHTLILFVAGLGIPFPMVPAVLWRMENGVSEDNPYMQYVGLMIAILIFGGCRKMTRNAADPFTKFWKIVCNGFYYLVLVEMIFLPFI